jgi:hypothetical protein
MEASSLRFEYLIKIEELAKSEIIAKPVTDYRLAAGLIFRRLGQSHPRVIVFDDTNELSWISGNDFCMPVLTKTVTELLMRQYLAAYVRRPNHTILCYEGAKKVVEEWFVDSTPNDFIALSWHYFP